MWEQHAFNIYVDMFGTNLLIQDLRTMHRIWKKPITILFTNLLSLVFTVEERRWTVLFRKNKYWNHTPYIYIYIIYSVDLLIGSIVSIPVAFKVVSIAFQEFKHFRAVYVKMMGYFLKGGLQFYLLFERRTFGTWIILHR